MSKTTQENKKKKALKEAKVEEQNLGKPIDGARQAQDDITPAETSTESSNTPEVTTELTEVEKVKKAKVRGKKYRDAKAKIDVNKYYPLKEAVKLVKETSISKFDGKVEAHITVLEAGSLGEIQFPHLELTAKKIVVLNEAILKELKDGQINFDVLVATPVLMPKLLPFAKLLGPKGLMPNPKAGTLTDKPEEAVKKLSVAKLSVKTEKKAPVVHIIVGKVSQAETELASNIEELIKVIKPSRLRKLAICATMGPSIKIAVQK